MDESALVEPFASAAQEFSDWWDGELESSEAIELKNAQPLNHYTDAKGLEGILKNEELWLTSIVHLNDPSELVHGIQIADNEFESQVKGKHWVIEEIRLQVMRFLADRVSLRFTFFVASLSLDGDELGQWRAYGDDGKGFAIGMAPEILRPPTPANTTRGLRFDGPILAQVIYDDAVAQSRQRQVVQKAIEAVEKCLENVRMADTKHGAQFLRSISSQLTMSVLWNSITTKHPAYKHEREMRLILVKGVKSQLPPTQTRASSSNLVPFVRVKLPLKTPGNIKRIVVGPAASPQSEDGVRHVLRSIGLEDDGLVARSKIPYRCRLL